MPKAVEEILFKEGRDYSIATTLDTNRHVVDEKSLDRDDVVNYLDRLADTILEFDSVKFNYYIKGKDKLPGLLFKKKFSDGTMVSFDFVSHKKRSIVLQTLYMDSADYQKKKSAKTLLMQNANSKTSKTQVGQTSNDSISDSTAKSQEDFYDMKISNKKQNWTLKSKSSRRGAACALISEPMPDFSRSAKVIVFVCSLYQILKFRKHFKSAMTLQKEI